MHALSAADLLLVWERGRTQGPLHQAIEILAVASPDRTREDLCHLTIGQRDAALLALRGATFGPRMSGVLVCPQCGARLELSILVSDVSVETADEPLEVIACEAAGYALRLRPPSTADIAASLQAPPEQRGNSLFRRCLLSATHGGGPVQELPNEVIDEAAKRICEADPQADVQLRVACSSCRHEWSVLFDIVPFFWNEIESRVSRLLGEVHALASVYGWSEKEILSLSPARRQFYLEATRA
jgi:hypothetical protein